MRYAFALLSVVAIWVALLLIVAGTDVNKMYLYCLALLMTLALYWFGFQRKKR